MGLDNNNTCLKFDIQNLQNCPGSNMASKFNKESVWIYGKMM